MIDLYYHIDLAATRALFIQHALIEGDWNTRHHFFQRNRERLAEVEELETRLRRRDLLVSEDVLYEFYDARVPENAVSQRHFDAWWRRERQSNPELLDFDPSYLFAADDDELDVNVFTDVFVYPSST